MKIIKTLTFTLLFAVAVVNSSIYGFNKSLVLKIDDTPSKTICIKNPAASNTTDFFSNTIQFSFEIFKAGSKDDVLKIINSFKNDAAVESCSEGVLTGDYLAISLTLKSNKNKAWFIKSFKKAGLKTIKINNNPIVEIEKI